MAREKRRSNFRSSIMADSPSSQVTNHQIHCELPSFNSFSSFKSPIIIMMKSRSENRKKNNSKSWLLSLLRSSMTKRHCPNHQTSDPLDLTQPTDFCCYRCCLQHFALSEPSFLQCMHYINEAGPSPVEILLPLLPKC